jgi:hypothetical protein
VDAYGLSFAKSMENMVLACSVAYVRAMAARKSLQKRLWDLRRRGERG